MKSSRVYLRALTISDAHELTIAHEQEGCLNYTDEHDSAVIPEGCMADGYGNYPLDPTFLKQPETYTDIEHDSQRDRYNSWNGQAMNDRDEEDEESTGFDENCAGFHDASSEYSCAREPWDPSKAVPDKTDHILTTIYDYIHDQRKASFTVYANTGGADPWFKLSASKHTTYGAQLAETYKKLYYIECLPEKGRKLIHLRRRPSSKPGMSISIRDIQVEVGGSWEAAGIMLMNRFGRRRIREARYKDWLAMNGKAFPFLDLPTELRYCVYGQLFGRYIYPCAAWRWPPNPDLDLAYPNLFVIPKITRSSGDCDYSPMNIFLTNRSIHQEATKIIWEGTTKLITYPGCIPEFFNFMMTLPFNCLGRIHLKFSNPDYLQLLGLNWSSDNPFSSSQIQDPVIKIVGNISALCVLELDFRVNTSPWHTRELRDVTEACQKVLVNWILTFAFEHIKHIRHIKLLGDVKNSSRVEWTKIFADERRLPGQHNLNDELQGIKKRGNHEL